jgi:hypothetical protein
MMLATRTGKIKTRLSWMDGHHHQLSPVSSTQSMWRERQPPLSIWTSGALHYQALNIDHKVHCLGSRTLASSGRQIGQHRSIYNVGQKSYSYGEFLRELDIRYEHQALPLPYAAHLSVIPWSIPKARSSLKSLVILPTHSPHSLHL